MKGSSKVIMGVTLTMLLSLAVVLGLVLVLLAELYCSLLLRRRNLRKTTLSSAAAVEISTSEKQDHPTAPTLSTFYAQGVLHAPRSFLFPSLLPPQNANNINFDLEKQNSQQPHQLGVLFSSSPLCPTRGEDRVVTLISPKLVHDEDEDATREDYMYICNPIYDSEANTQFETPDSSPSRLDGQSECCSPASSVALTPMKELPAKACSVSLKDASCSIGTSRSDSVSNNDGVSTSSSCSPSTSSW